jgi:hypothetical protein
MSIAEGALICCSCAASKIRLQKPHSVAKKTNFASFSVVPADRNFPNAQPGAMREKKQLNIECKTIHMRRLQNWPANIELKRFEPTLGIPKWQAGCNAHKKIKNTTALFSPPGLMDSNQTAIQSARTKSNINFAVCNRFD